MNMTVLVDLRDVYRRAADTQTQLETQPLSTQMIE